MRTATCSKCSEQFNVPSYMEGNLTFCSVCEMTSFLTELKDYFNLDDVYETLEDKSCTEQ